VLAVRRQGAGTRRPLRWLDGRSRNTEESICFRESRIDERAPHLLGRRRDVADVDGLRLECADVDSWPGLTSGMRRSPVSSQRLEVRQDLRPARRTRLRRTCLPSPFKLPWLTGELDRLLPPNFRIVSRAVSISIVQRDPAPRPSAPDLNSFGASGLTRPLIRNGLQDFRGVGRAAVPRNLRAQGRNPASSRIRRWMPNQYGPDGFADSVSAGPTASRGVVRIVG